ncbi:MAG: hypothetical protein ACM3PC_12540 [Deltaproteobacteria bacterium]
MREFASPSTRAAALPRPVKVLYTAFCGFTVLGLLSCVGLYDGIVGFAARATPAQLYANLVAHYQQGMEPHKLLEVTHFHLFSVPLYLLVVGHLFLLSGRSAAAKTGIVTAAVALTALHLVAPWAVALGGRALAWLYPISGAGMLLGFAVLMGVPVYEMWSARPARA